MYKCSSTEHKVTSLPANLTMYVVSAGQHTFAYVTHFNLWRVFFFLKKELFKHLNSDWKPLLL